MTSAAVAGPRDRLLRAARTVLERDGLEGLSLRAVARQAGVSHGAPLRHFPSFAQLLAALAAWGFEQLMASVDQAVGATDDPLTRLSRSGHGYVRFALAEPGVYAVMFRPDLVDVTDPAYREASSASFAQLVALVAAAQAAGLQPEVPTEQLAAVSWAQVHGLAELWLHGSLQDVVGVEAFEDLVRLAVGPP